MYRKDIFYFKKGHQISQVSNHNNNGLTHRNFSYENIRIQDVVDTTTDGILYVLVNDKMLFCLNRPNERETILDCFDVLIPNHNIQDKDLKSLPLSTGEDIESAVNIISHSRNKQENPLSIDVENYIL